jgi:hypothetical protein
MQSPPTPTAEVKHEGGDTQAGAGGGGDAGGAVAGAAPVARGTKPRRFNNGWSSDLENLVADWADKGRCYSWMHDKTSRKQAAYNQCMMIPVIVLSTLTGTANFGLDTLFTDPGHKKIASLGIGGFGILTGIISTLANFLRYAQGSEAHSVASVSWSKFSRHATIELALNPNDRIEAFAFLKMFRIELDRLIEQSPSIPEDIVKRFKQEFRNNTELRRPEITGVIEHTPAFDNKAERLKNLAAEASLIIMHKKKVLRDIVMEDLDTRVRKVMAEAAAARAAEHHDDDNGDVLIVPKNINTMKIRSAPLSPSVLKYINSRAESPGSKDNIIIDVDTHLARVNTINQPAQEENEIVVDGVRIYDKTQ